MARFKDFSVNEIGVLIASVDFRIINMTSSLINQVGEDVTKLIYAELGKLSDELHAERYNRNISEEGCYSKNEITITEAKRGLPCPTCNWMPSGEQTPPLVCLKSI